MHRLDPSKGRPFGGGGVHRNRGHGDISPHHLTWQAGGTSYYGRYPPGGYGTLRGWYPLPHPSSFACPHVRFRVEYPVIMRALGLVMGRGYPHGGVHRTMAGTLQGGYGTLRGWYPLPHSSLSRGDPPPGSTGPGEFFRFLRRE
jgi:hypothetical protein